VCSCQTDQFAHWLQLWDAGTSHGVLISHTVARAAAWNSFKAHKPDWRAGVGERFSLFFPSFLTFICDISRVLAPWMDGWSFPSPCQSFPSSSSPSALPRPSLKHHIYIFLTFKSSSGGYWLTIAGSNPVISMSNRWQSSLTRVRPIPQTDSLTMHYISGTIYAGSYPRQPNFIIKLQCRMGYGVCTPLPKSEMKSVIRLLSMASWGPIQCYILNTS